MSRPRLEVADIFRASGPAYRAAHAGALSLGQLKVMSAIEACRTASLGGHVSACADCGSVEVAYNSCRNRHCPKCQAAAAHDWLDARRAELLPVEYFHVVFTLPAPIAAIALTNKAVVYDALFKAAAATLTTIGADARHLGARVAATMVLHTWGSAMTHHPHVHCIVPGGGLSPDGVGWMPCRKGFFLPVRVLSRLFRRLMLERLIDAHGAGKLVFFGDSAALADLAAFRAHLKPLWRRDWVVYAKRPFAGPEQVVSYLARYTHRVAIANSRILAIADGHVTFKVKDYRKDGQARYGAMRLSVGEFMRRFLLHVLPTGFHRIRHIGFLGNGVRVEALAAARRLLDVVPPSPSEEETAAAAPIATCRCCGGRLVLIETIERPRWTPRCEPAPAGVDSS